MGFRKGHKKDITDLVPAAVGNNSMLLQPKLTVGAVNDPLEQQADDMAETVMKMKDNTAQVGADHIQRTSTDEEDEIVQKKPLTGFLQKKESQETTDTPSLLTDQLQSTSGNGSSIDPSTKSFMESRFMNRFDDVNIHTNEDAIRMNRALNAKAFTVGRDVYFNEHEYKPQTNEGKFLLAHELTHVLQQKQNSHSEMISMKKTKGEVMVDKGNVFLDEDSNLKIETDVLKVALREISKGKSVDFNRKAGKVRIDAVGVIQSLSVKDITALKADWDWLIDNISKAKDKGYKTKKSAFFDSMTSRIDKIGNSHKHDKVKFWLRNTPASLVDIMYTLSSAVLPTIEIYNYAMLEGLDAWVRNQIGLAKSDTPTKAQLATVTSVAPVSGFDTLGLDDFVTDFANKDGLIKAAVPAGFDKKFTESIHQNEKGRDVHSADFSNMTDALIAMVASLKRRRQLFKNDAAAFGYTSPTKDELVYWTYVYYNSGEFGGKAQLDKYQGKRKLSDWISKGEYPKAMIALDNFKMLETMNLF